MYGITKNFIILGSLIKIGKFYGGLNYPQNNI